MAYQKIRSKKKLRCKFCDNYFITVDDYVIHLETKHSEMIPSDMVPWQYYYFLKTNRTHGSCVMCKKPTTWNERTHKYNRFCGSEKCKDRYREIFKKRMISSYGKVSLLDDPERQRMMLSHRSISGVYEWSSDPRYKFTYTGSYELAFLVFLDLDLQWDPNDIMSPSPHNYTYIYEGNRHMYFPDFFIPSLDLEVEIKDGGSNPNTHTKIVAVDKEKERLKDAVMASNTTTFNYLKIEDKDHIRFFDFLEKYKEQFENGINKKICML